MIKEENQVWVDRLGRCSQSPTFCWSLSHPGDGNKPECSLCMRIRASCVYPQRKLSARFHLCHILKVQSTKTEVVNSRTRHMQFIMRYMGAPDNRKPHWLGYMETFSLHTTISQPDQPWNVISCFSHLFYEKFRNGCSQLRFDESSYAKSNWLILTRLMILS